MERARHCSAAKSALTFIVVALLAGCGDDARTPPRSENAAPPPATAEGPVPSSHTPVSASEHETFEKLYKEQCIKSQQGKADTAIRGDQELGRVCECMAKEISQRISKADAVHFNVKKEFPIDLVMMTDAAANHCMNAQP